MKTRRELAEEKKANAEIEAAKVRESTEESKKAAAEHEANQKVVDDAKKVADEKAANEKANFEREEQVRLSKLDV